MSRYEQYEMTSRNYDKIRLPIGLEIILGCLAKSGKPLNEMIVLDAGCGSGSYCRALSDYVKRIDAVDISRAMLTVASLKRTHQRGGCTINLCQSRVDCLPFKEGSYDGAMINQVLHHLDDPDDKDHPTQRRMFRELYLLLRHKGTLVINTCSNEQLRHGFWYYSLIPEAVDEIFRRYTPIDQLVAMLSDYGFTYQGSFVPLEGVLQGEAYFDPYGPLKGQWRDADSIFALVTPDQLNTVRSRIRDMDSRGTLLSFVKEHDSRRKLIGQATFLLAVRE
jgi:ubiquinone/menaquinone biosynthesis C-methylase UbiE